MKPPPSPSLLAKYFAGDPELTNEDRERVRKLLLERPALQRHWKGQTPAWNVPAAWWHVDRRLMLSRSPLRVTGSYAMAAVVAFLAFSAILVAFLMGTFDTRPGADATHAMREVATDRGQRANITLTDGTTILLSVDSRLEYPAGFDTERREVFLEGEAYFVVAPDVSRPFLVHAGSSVTRVLGTEFSVRAYPADDDIRVVVSEGKVSFRSEFTDPDQGTILSDRQVGLLSRAADSPVRVLSNVDLEQHISWLQGRLVFEEAPLSEILPYLERWYAVEINLADPALGDRRLTGSFRDESIREVMQLISLSLNLEFSMQDRQIMLRVRG